MKWDVSSIACALSGLCSALWDGVRGLASTEEAGGVLGDVEAPVSVEIVTFKRLWSTRFRDFLRVAAPVRRPWRGWEAGGGVGWRLWVGAAVPPTKGQDPQSPTRTHLPVRIFGGAGVELFHHHPHELRTSPLGQTHRGNEVGLEVTSSPLQHVEGGALLLRVDLTKSKLLQTSKAHCLWR